MATKSRGQRGGTRRQGADEAARPGERPAGGHGGPLPGGGRGKKASDGRGGDKGKPPDSLSTYEAKRRFGITPEPAPGTGGVGVEARGGLSSFVVHKHDASRLHYDLRLEMDGALASWAVPKGPSYDPSIKRLAVATEDHPLEYGSFEGRIPDGEYGAGDSLLWDRGGWDTIPPGQAEAQREKGHLHFELHGEKLQGGWHLVRTSGRGGSKAPSEKAQWLLFKAKDDWADPDFDVVGERPESVISGRTVTRGPERKGTLAKKRPEPEALLAEVQPPMLAQAADAPPSRGADWLWELKYDGFRALAALSNGRVALQSRNGLDLAGRFPQVAESLSGIVVGDAILDGEIVALDPQGGPSFQLLQQGEEAEAQYFAFDLLRLDGEDLRQRPLEERRDLLVSLLSNPPANLRLAEILEGEGGAALEEAAARGFEGLIAKKRGSRYENRRSTAWRKLKVLAEQELAIVGFNRTSTGGDAIGSLLLAVAEEGGFRYAGKVGTGFSSRQRGELFRLLDADVVAKPGVVNAPRGRGTLWVKPRYVAQVRFTEWTRDGCLRHPSFLGLRPDKKPEECIRESPVAVRSVASSAPSGSAGPARASRTTRPRPSSQPSRKLAPEVKLTNPGRLYYPEDKLTKTDVADYYQAVSDVLLPVLADRPLALEHWPKGIHEPSWFQQNIGGEAEPWMTLVDTPTSDSGRLVKHLVADRPEALRWLAQHAVLTLHMWSSRTPHLTQPDWVVFDLDPADGRDVQQAIPVARALHMLLEALSLPHLVKTSGKRGLHVFVPLLAGHTHEDAIAFALEVGRAVVEVIPDATLERAIAKRGGRLYLDCLQNGYGKTVVAPYSLRALPGAPVSTPLRWTEVSAGLDPGRFNLRTLPGRLAEVGDLFAPVLAQGVRLPRFRSSDASLSPDAISPEP